MRSTSSLPFVPRALAFGLALAGASIAQESRPASQAPSPPEPSASTETPEQGTLVLQLDGNRRYCVKWNEIPLREGAVRPRHERSGPLITTYGYKYQISATRRGATGVTKLFESPAIRTAYNVRERPPNLPPSPRLPTPEDLKAETRPPRSRESTRWIKEHTCTDLKPEYSFPIAPGRYDVYLGFDLLVSTGSWVPLQSDYVTDVSVERDQKTRIRGRVDFSNGVRTVKFEPVGRPRPAGKP